MRKGMLKDTMNAQEFKEFWDKREAAKNSKFGAIPTQNRDGEEFQSLLESSYYDKYKLLRAQGDLIKFERQVRFEFVVNDVFITSYKVDFILYWKDGRVEHIDCKSQPTVTQVYKLKKALMKAIYGIDVIEVYK
jgi:hypothetical protein